MCGPKTHSARGGNGTPRLLVRRAAIRLLANAPRSLQMSMTSGTSSANFTIEYDKAFIDKTTKGVQLSSLRFVPSDAKRPARLLASAMGAVGCARARRWHAREVWQRSGVGC